LQERVLQEPYKREKIPVGKMGKKIYTIEGRHYIVDDETGKVKEVIIKETNIPPETIEKLIKILAKEANRND
jgi:tRNA(Ile2) C34 agmatinyltransferase TiaS